MKEIIEVKGISKSFFIKDQEIEPLKEISFSVKENESIAVIGKNGTGKTTLLKLLSSILKPTKGNIKIRGKVLSIIDIGGGFHPELSGKENIYFAGNLHGLSKKEIDIHYHKIVDFADLGPSLDLPVKTYSSGMFLRLAFSCAAFFPCDILIIDEVLQVGDKDFQEKSLKRIWEIKESGVSIIHASHNFDGFEGIFEKAIIVGKNTFEIGDFKRKVFEYKFPEKIQKKEIQSNSIVRLKEVIVDGLKAKGKLISHSNQNPICITFLLECNKKIDDLHTSIDISQGKIPLIFSSSKFENENFIKEGLNKVEVTILEELLSAGTYFVTLWVGTSEKTILLIDTVFSLKIRNEETNEYPWDFSERNQPVRLSFNWKNL